jgi:hypothetical protein
MGVAKFWSSPIAQLTEILPPRISILSKKLPQCALNPQTCLPSYGRLVEMIDRSIGMEWSKKANCEADARKSGFLEVIPCPAF